MNNETKHTPGPWFRRKEWKSDRRALEIYPKDPTVKPPFKPSAVAVVNWVRDGEAIANARLIAAAPDLKGVAMSASVDCSNVAECLRKIGGTECEELAAILDGVVARNGAAIAKATGEQP